MAGYIPGQSELATRRSVPGQKVAAAPACLPHVVGPPEPSIAETKGKERPASLANGPPSSPLYLRAVQNPGSADHTVSHSPTPTLRHAAQPNNGRVFNSRERKNKQNIK
ncbi:uncharacterized protein CIMG_06746 [Coccidioides immitis RS]|uniref:Uncharacterized protein n=3 Tax=Coccidioides immitis TaxID=5501 RepID=J3K8T8_COCIM|nr:uncharacterized protein CIMG_06746 [Coccidioides immitis RS]EAS31267.3 hypothetical protein CIMG_06746 [Coccidioides immitis RS]KMP03888.1 hypothetical protein CIRG_03580 [Coccidioides immitis RMSCC 2394]KMU86044.1 hypothetical protein CIHG_03830 [Coccidioides immitis H538.4]